MGKYLKLLSQQQSDKTLPQKATLSPEKELLYGTDEGDYRPSPEEALPTTLTTKAFAGQASQEDAGATTETTKPPASQRAGGSTGQDLVEATLGMTLTEFEQSRRCLEVAVLGLPSTLWFVPGVKEAESLRMDGIRRGRIWTVVELRDLMAAPGMTHEDAIAIARAKMEFNGTVDGVRPDAPHEPDQTNLDLGPQPREFD